MRKTLIISALAATVVLPTLASAQSMPTFWSEPAVAPASQQDPLMTGRSSGRGFHGYREDSKTDSLTQHQSGNASTRMNYPFYFPF